MNAIKPLDLEELKSVPPLSAQSVAAAVASLTDTHLRSIIWFLHFVSHQEGGLKRFAHEMLAHVFPDKLGTKSMVAAGNDPSAVYEGELYDRICDELDSSEHESRATLQGKIVAARFFDQVPFAEWYERMKPEHRKATAHALLLICRDRCRELPATLRSLCLNGGKWDVRYFVGFREALESTIAGRIEAAKCRAAPTKTVEIVGDVLRYCSESRVLGVIEGTERLGKSLAARVWQEANAGCARLIDLTAATNDLQFYQEIWKALGCADASKGDSSEMRMQIRAATQNRDLMLVFDEAHFLFGVTPRASIKRLEYLRTEFVNKGIPVVLVITPQFSARLQDMERGSGFNTNQFRGRIMKWQKLPAPSEADIERVAHFAMPGAPKRTIELLCACAAGGPTPFVQMQRAILEAKDLAARTGREPTDPEVLRQAVGFSAYTSAQIDATIPAPNPSRRRRGPIAVELAPATPTLSTPAPAAPSRLQERCINPAKEVSDTPSRRGQASILVG